MKTIITSLILLCLTSWNAQSADLEISATQIVGYGVFEAASVRRDRSISSSAIGRDDVRGVQFIEYTSDIPAVLGKNFGFQYIINSQPAGSKVDVTHVIKFPSPGLVRPGGQVFEVSREERTARLGHETLHGYGFDVEWEIVPGEWTFEVWHNDALIVRKSFNVIEVEESQEDSVAAE